MWSANLVLGAGVSGPLQVLLWVGVGRCACRQAGAEWAQDTRLWVDSTGVSTLSLSNAFHAPREDARLQIAIQDKCTTY